MVSKRGCATLKKGDEKHIAPSIGSLTTAIDAEDAGMVDADDSKWDVKQLRKSTRPR